MDTLIQKIFLQIIKIINFRGELTDISAKKEALLVMCARMQHTKCCMHTDNGQGMPVQVKNHGSLFMVMFESGMSFELWFLAIPVLGATRLDKVVPNGALMLKATQTFLTRKGPSTDQNYYRMTSQY